MVQKSKKHNSRTVIKKTTKHLGMHFIVEFWYGKVIKDPQKLKNLLIESAKAANNTPLEVVIHKFEPQGITGVVLLAESHIALHFWPETHYIAIDIFTCGDKSMPQKALDYLKREIKPQKVEFRKIKRGKIVSYL